MSIRLTNTIASIANWFKAAVPEPDERNQTTQLGVHFEEVGEMVHVLNQHFDGITTLGYAERECVNLSHFFKRGGFEIDLSDEHKKELLDALCDQIVTAVGVAVFFKMNIQAALAEVDDSNWSKFVDGVPLFDENKKIIKGPNYFRAVLDNFIN